ncbi:MAG: ABC transporter permease, partial [Bacteroidota bacterium]
KDYGFSVDHAVTVKMSGVSDLEGFRTEIQRDAKVSQTSFTSSLFGAFPEECKVKLQGAESGVYVNYYATDAQFLSSYGIELLQGRNLVTANQNEVIVNETFVQRLKALGGAGVGDVIVAKDSLSLTIVGVFEDFNYDNLKRPIEPLMLWSIPEEFKYLSIQLWDNTSEKAYSTNLAQELYQRYQKRMQTQVYATYLADRRDYSDDQSAVQMVTFFIILITCMGLVGTVLVNSDYLRKSIAINKLMGARKSDLLRRYLSGYVKLMGIVFLLALPLAYFIGQQLLSQFVYRVPINFSHFVEILVTTATILLVVIISQMLYYFRTQIIDGIKSD